MKSYNVYVNNGLKGSEVWKQNLSRDVSKEQLIKDYDKLIKLAKKDFPKAEFVDVLIQTTPKYSKKNLMNVGQMVADGWGGSCIGLKCFPNSIQFQCVEHGEQFVVHYSYADLEKEYKEYLK